MISLIIPAYNEADQIAGTIAKIRERCGTAFPEIIVVDGGSTDNTRSVAEAAGGKNCLGNEGEGEADEPWCTYREGRSILLLTRR